MASSEGIEAACPDLGACRKKHKIKVKLIESYNSVNNMDTTVMKRNTDLPKPFKQFIIQTINFLIY